MCKQIMYGLKIVTFWKIKDEFRLKVLVLNGYEKNNSK